MTDISPPRGPSPFRRDGHLTDLALEYVLDGQRSEDATTHLESCTLCAERLEAAEAVELPPLPAQRPQQTTDSTPTPASQIEPANRPWMWAIFGAVASAALVLLVVRGLAPSEPDGFRVKGNGLALQVFRDAGEASERLRDGDLIAPGDRLGFRLRNRMDGHLLVFGIDATDATYVCYPQAQGGGSAPIVAQSRPTPLPEAIRMDDTPGAERIVALLCDAPFTLDDVEAELRDGRAPEGCVFDDVTLEKP